MSGWEFGGWPPPAPTSGGAVSFEAVRDALGAATTNVPFNFMGLTQVGSVNLVKIESSTDLASMRLGDTAMDAVDGFNRVAIGQDAAAGATTATDLVAIGNLSQRLVTVGVANTSVGQGSLSSLTTGSSNTAIGGSAGLALVGGQQNTAVGSHALEAGVSTSGSVAIGYQAAKLQTGDDNVAVGWGAAALATTGTDNTCVGHGAGPALTTGSNNTLIGENAGDLLSTASSCTFLGSTAGTQSTADFHVCIGATAQAPDAAVASGISIGNRIYGGLNGTDYKVRLGGTGTIATQTEALQVINTGDDTVPVLALSTTGTNGAKSSVYVGTRDPSGAVSALGGSIYIRVNGATSQMYQNRTAGTGTSWSLVTAVP